MRGVFSLVGPARLAVVAVVVLGSTALWASERIKGVGPFDPQAETVELFSAVEQGQLEVKLIPRDSAECRVLITNKTDKPLNVALPEALAGVPVAAQIGPGPDIFQPGGNNRNNANNGPQRLGIGNPLGNNLWGNQGNQGNRFGNNRWGNQGNQLFNVPGGNNQMPGPGNVLPGAGMPNFAPFSVAPENVAQLKLRSVCLDYGKPTPRPKMHYELKPIESVSDKAEVQELCRMLGQGQVSQQAAQAAAWHLANGMTWEQLAGLRRVFALARISEPYFTQAQLAEGKKAAEAVTEQQEQGEPAKSDSLSMR
jgi:hypothetical protein